MRVLIAMCVGSQPKKGKGLASSIHEGVCVCVLTTMFIQTDWDLVSAPDPTDAAADGLHHRYASVGSGDTGNNFVARECHDNQIYSALVTRI